MPDAVVGVRPKGAALAIVGRVLIAAFERLETKKKVRSVGSGADDQRSTGGVSDAESHDSA